MAPVRAALDRIVDGHEPYATVVVDRRWNVVTANAAALSVLTEGVAPDLLAGRRHRPRRDHRRASHQSFFPADADTAAALAEAAGRGRS